MRQTICRRTLVHLLCSDNLYPPSFTGTVIRTTLVKMLEFEKDFMCARCKHVFSVQVS